MSVGVPVLMYHAIAEHPAAQTRRLSVRPAMLAEQLAWLTGHGFRTLTFSELMAARRKERPLPERPVVLTFDDGYADFHSAALPLLAEYGCVATVFVTTGWVEDAGEQRAGNPLDRMLAWTQIDEVSAAGMEIGAHSHSHAELDQLHDDALMQELSASKSLLEDRLGCEIPALAYPYGYSSRRVRTAVRTAGYRHAAAVANATSRPPHSPFAMPRLTIRRSTSLDTFGQVLQGRRVARTFLLDRILTAGWSVVRTRHLL
ncbi:polysaccharide deacetylase family protein [Pseudonocardia sp. H11422]|uniref:polysaccharide deacetylase family protein n=1 Tax=Pseudonocardia sp. H11422 TaxID=2835866 RepID=UPI001BDBB63B|nr:polysaccharide deacetylase family protein [Pseudonocardia sp. H11422]